MEYLVSSKELNDCHVTPHDFRNANAIYDGPVIAGVRGKQLGKRLTALIIRMIINLAGTCYTYAIGAHVLAIFSDQNVPDSRNSILYSIPFHPMGFCWEPFCGRRL